MVKKPTKPGLGGSGSRTSSSSRRFTAKPTVKPLRGPRVAKHPADDDGGRIPDPPPDDDPPKKKKARELAGAKAKSTESLPDKDTGKAASSKTSRKTKTANQILGGALHAGPKTQAPGRIAKSIALSDFIGSIKAEVENASALVSQAVKDGNPTMDISHVTIDFPFSIDDESDEKTGLKVNVHGSILEKISTERLGRIHVRLLGDVIDVSVPDDEEK